MESLSPMCWRSFVRNAEIIAIDMQLAQSPSHLFTLVILTAVSVVLLNMILPSVAQIAEEFDVSWGHVNLAISGYLAITAVPQIIVGPMSDRFGRRPVLLVSVAVFAIASVGSSLPPPLPSEFGTG
ncbi:MFS transporter [Sedimentitalea todarodis]|uniref:MFS transporter n=1 Tax=Sedimentitalea todarodis TaxID=1631240 RepID=A0ABU3VC59_9RHOB|nr:MFS transporter [Sedimentitalea todarodis]MDU9003762.1 MFS transporter [Sedimentitalea todarodis]